MSFDIDSDSIELSLRRSEVKHIIQALIFQKEYIENTKEQRITQTENGFRAMFAMIQRLVDDMECFGINHRNLIKEFKEREERIDRRLDNLENKLLQSGEDVCITIEKFSAMIRKDLLNLDSIYKRVYKKVIKSEEIKNTDNYDEINSFPRKNNTTPNNSVPFYSPSETVISENCRKSSYNSIMSSLNVKNTSNSNIVKDINAPLTNSEGNMKMESAGNSKLNSSKNNNEKDELKSKRFVMEGLETYKTGSRNFYRFSANVDVVKEENEQSDNLNESPDTYFDLIYNDDVAVFYQYKSTFLLKYFYGNGSTRKMCDLTYRILLDKKKELFLLVIEKEKMDNAKLVIKIDENFMFYLVSDCDVYCEYVSKDSDSKEEKEWMMSFDNKNDSKEFYDRIINVQAKK